MLKIVKHIWLAVLLLAVQPAFCQYFNLLHDADTSDDWGYNVFEQANGNYFVIGSCRFATTNRNGIVAMEISSDGQQVLNKKMLCDTVNELYPGYADRVKRLDDGSYLIPWVLHVPASPQSMMMAGMIKMDADGDTIFTRLYTDTAGIFKREGIQDCIQMQDGGYLLGGERNIGIGRGAVLLIRTDEQGNKLWEKIYRTSQQAWDNLQTIEALDNGNILIGARNMVFKSVGQFDYYAERPWFIITDSAGNIIKDTLYSQGYCGGGNIHKDKNGGYYHWGALDSFITSNPLDFENLPGYITHLDENFNIEWRKLYADQQEHTYISNVKQLPNKSYLAVGSFWNTITAVRGWASEIIHPGFTKWEQTYLIDSSRRGELVSAASKSNGGFVFTGRSRDVNLPPWQQHDVWIVGVDSYGCVIPNCAPTEIEEIAIKKENMLIYPNPTEGKFSIQSQYKGTLYLSDMSGRLIEHYKVNEGTTNLVLPTTLTPGVYTTRFVYDGNKAGKVEKLVYRP